MLPPLRHKPQLNRTFIALYYEIYLLFLVVSRQRPTVTSPARAGALSPLPSTMDPVTEFLQTRVYWYPTDAPARVVEGDYLNNWGVPTLACGLGELVEHLELELVGDDYERVQDEVNRQLADRDYAVIECPHGKARLEVVDP